MKKWIFIIFFLLLFSFTYWFLMTPMCVTIGDEEAIGAIIYVDGEKAGVMEKRVSNLYDPPKPFAAKSLFFFGGGEHTFKFVSRGGKVLEKKIFVYSECYIDVYFSTMKIY